MDVYGRYWFFAIPSLLTMLFVYVVVCVFISLNLLRSVELGHPHTAWDAHTVVRTGEEDEEFQRNYTPNSGEIATIGDLRLQYVNQVLYDDAVQ